MTPELPDPLFPLRDLHDSDPHQFALRLCRAAVLIEDRLRDPDFVGALKLSAALAHRRLAVEEDRDPERDERERIETVDREYTEMVMRHYRVLIVGKDSGPLAKTYRALAAWYRDTGREDMAAELPIITAEGVAVLDESKPPVPLFLLERIEDLKKGQPRREGETFEFSDETDESAWCDRDPLFLDTEGTPWECLKEIYLTARHDLATHADPVLVFPSFKVAFRATEAIPVWPKMAPCTARDLVVQVTKGKPETGRLLDLFLGAAPASGPSREPVRETTFEVLRKFARPFRAKEKKVAEEAASYQVQEGGAE